MSSLGVGSFFSSGCSNSGGGGLLGGGGLSGNLRSLSFKVSSFLILIKSTICLSLSAFKSRSPGLISIYININKRKDTNAPPDIKNKFFLIFFCCN